MVTATYCNGEYKFSFPKVLYFGKDNQGIDSGNNTPREIEGPESLHLTTLTFEVVDEKMWDFSKADAKQIPAPLGLEPDITTVLPNHQQLRSDHYLMT